MAAPSQPTPETQGWAETQSDAIIVCIEGKEDSTVRPRRKPKTTPEQGQGSPPTEGNPPPQTEDPPKPTDS
jgi:hypothetical protein